MTQDEWFAAVSKSVRELHDLSHKCEQFDIAASEVAEIVGVLTDALEYTTNTASYELKYLTPYDSASIRDLIENKVLWRLH